MEKLRYAVAEYQGQSAHLVSVPYGDGRGHAATKIRLPNKDFRYIGDTKAAGLVFQDRWPSGGRKVVITEGEFDALSVSTAQDDRYPVVSLPNGAAGAVKSLTNAYKWLDSFEEIILWFDNDEPGRKAAEECAVLFAYGKVKIACAPSGFKDANEMLKAHDIKGIINCIWRAEDYTPARFISFKSLKVQVMAPPVEGIPWIFPELNDWTYGRRGGEVYFFGAGTGVGKTDFFTQQAARDIAEGEKVAMFSFESHPVETAKRLAGKYSGHRFHIPDAGWVPDDLEQSFNALEKSDAYIYDHWGSADWATVSQDITLLAHMGYRHFYIDHLTAFAAHADDERRMLEGVCADMAGLAAKLGVMFYVISHLSTPDGTPHEEGGRVFVRHFKGSRAIGYWAHFMFGIERNTQAEDTQERARGRFRCLKDRFTGNSTGKTLTLLYDPLTGLQSVDNDWVWPGKEGGSSPFTDQREQF